MKKVALIGEHNPHSPTHAATNTAILHASHHLGIQPKADWISTTDITENILKDYQAFLIAPGSPYKNMVNALRVIQYARENQVPCLGTCGGFQHIILEYARNVLGFQDASHAEYNPYASNLFITPLTCSLSGKEMTLAFKKNSQIAKIYNATQAKENYYCNFSVNPEFIPLFNKGPLKTTGSDSEGEMRVVELENHHFFIGTLFVPQTKSSPEAPHPIIMAFLSSL